MRRLVLILILPLAAGLLAACTNPMAKYKPTYAELHTYGWSLGPPLDELPTTPVYCYDSIGTAECYATPLADERSRFIVGYEGAPPPPYETIQ